MTIKEITDDCLDNPTSQDYKWDPPEELNGINSKRPKDKVIVQNQQQTPGCTYYSQYHIVNGYNILEDERQGIDRPQIDPLIPRNKFCAKRGYYNKGSDIQTVANNAKKDGVIEGWATIEKKLPNDVQVEKMKKTLDMGYFMCCGSSNGDRGKTKTTGIYTLRTDGKFVGHAWSIVDYDLAKGFLCINSRGKRGKEQGYFWLPFNIVDKVYNKLVIIDKPDDAYFQRIKSKSKAITLIRDARSLYESADNDTKIFLEKAGISKFLMANYGINESEI